MKSEPGTVVTGFLKAPLLTKEGRRTLRATGWFSLINATQSSKHLHSRHSPLFISLQFCKTNRMKTEKELSELRTQIEAYEPEIQDSYNIFNLKLANEWMRSAAATPPQSELFGEFWLEGELALLFSDTNLGKSTLAL